MTSAVSSATNDLKTARTREELLGIYKLMVFSRVLDRAVGEYDGHWHGCEGEEAIVAGAYFGLRPSDVLAPHYRGGPAAAYAKGADLYRLLAGLLDKHDGYFRGRHRVDICGPPELNLIGLYSGSLGPPLGYATGSALAMKLDQRDDVAVAVFGDGVSSRGDCHEAMNLASVQQLPVLFICQNNAYAISTELSAGVGGAIAERGAGYGMPGIAVDGNDVLAVYEAVQSAIERARAGQGPSLIEAVSYRVAGHFYSDQEDYRDPDIVERWRARDPIELFHTYLLANCIAPEPTLQDFRQEIEAEIEMAMARAIAAAPPDPSNLDAHAVFAE